MFKKKNFQLEGEYKHLSAPTMYRSKTDHFHMDCFF